MAAPESLTTGFRAFNDISIWMVYEGFMTMARRIRNVQVDESGAVWLSGSALLQPKQWSA
jgi:hypothetical protein